jgi:hypothetical protein
LSNDVAPRNPITGTADCCARAESGQAAAPPSSLMNARRFIDRTLFNPTKAKSQHIELAAASQRGGLLGPQHINKRK